MAERKLTKAQRARLLPQDLKDAMDALSDEAMLAAHDYTHAVMERRFGTHSRPQVGEIVCARAAAKSATPVAPSRGAG